MMKDLNLQHVKEELNNNAQKVKEYEYLQWMKNKLKGLWTSQKFCGVCLETEGHLNPSNMEFLLTDKSKTMQLWEIINQVFKEDDENVLLGSNICDRCTEIALQSYAFIHSSVLMNKIITKCITDLNSKVFDITENIDMLANYENSNVMMVLEYDEEVYNYIEEIKAGYEIIPSPNHFVTKTTKELINTSIKKIETPKNAPVIKPTARVIVKKPRPIIPPAKVVEKKVETKTEPTFKLKEGKLEIKPLNPQGPNSRTSVPTYNTYGCSYCPNIFTTYRSLKDHEKNNHNTVVFPCQFCDKVYNTQQYLNVHYKTHDKERCKICRELLNLGELSKHLGETHRALVHACSYCDLVYYTPEELETHYKACHLVSKGKVKDNKSEQCVMCLRHFSPYEIKNHKCKFSCSECTVMPCLHYNYLSYLREQMLSYSDKIKCLDCDYVCKRKEHMIAHVNREHLDHHPFTCADCGNQFYTKLSLKTHMVQFHQDLNCQYCDRELKTMIMLEQHRDICKLITRPYSCDKCVASFDSEDELRKHESVKHSEIFYPCTLCKKEFLTEVDLKEHHARAHNGIQVKRRRKFIECTLCDKTFRNLKDMLQHEKTHESGTKYPCNVCPKEFTSLKKVYLHKQKHYTQRVRCNGCKKRIANSYYAQHQAKCPYKTPSALPYVCPSCGKGFRTESTLRIHKLKHIEKVPCRLCGKMIKPIGMKRHMKIRHEENHELNDGTKNSTLLVMLECEYCGHLSRKKDDLEAHMNRYHLKIKPYSCDVCKKTFCGKARLKEHLTTHTNNNACFCQTCGKKFANRVCLKMHIRRHTGENPYTCDICGDNFRSSSIMKTHRLKKHLDKTIACPLCDSMFHIVRELRQHIKKVHWKHKDKPFNFKEMEELGKEYYHIFDDGRLPKMSE